MGDVPMYSITERMASGFSPSGLFHKSICITLCALPLRSDDVFQETSARSRAVEPEQWLQRHPEAGSSWSSWPKASHPPFGGRNEGTSNEPGLIKLVSSNTLRKSQGSEIFSHQRCQPCTF